MLGLFSMHPHSRNPASTDAAASATTAARRPDISPAMGSATLPITLPSLTTTWPPSQAASSLTACAMHVLVRSRDDELVTVVRHRGGHRAPRGESEPVHETHPDRSRRRDDDPGWPAWRCPARCPAFTSPACDATLKVRWRVGAWFSITPITWAVARRAVAGAAKPEICGGGADAAGAPSAAPIRGR